MNPVGNNTLIGHSTHSLASACVCKRSLNPITNPKTKCKISKSHDDENSNG